MPQDLNDGGNGASTTQRTDPRPSAESVIATFDWAQTSLGPRDAWPSSLRTVLRLMLSSRYAMWLGWGPELTFFCNDAYRDQTLGAKYPWAIGRPAREVWAEIWDILERRIRHVLGTGEATYDEGLLLFLERSGYSEETYHSFSYSAAPGDAAGEIGGLFCVVVEETERVIGQRRIALLGRFASRLSSVKTPADVFAALAACLAEDARDVPFAIVYLFDDTSGKATRVFAHGIDGAHAAAPANIDLRDENAPWPLASVLARAGPLVVDLDPRQPWPTGPWKRSPSRALLLPIASATGEGSGPVGVLVAGLNPHRPCNDKMREFLALLVGQLAAGLSTAGAYELERKRGEALAAIDRAKTAFFSNVSHEFRTPLTLMLGPMQEAQATPEHSLGGEALDTAYRNALRLLKLVNALLDVSRLEAGRIRAAYEKTDLAAFTAELASVFRSAIERAGLRFVVETSPIDAPVYVDRDMWEKIVLNLLSNALKFTFEGEIAVSLRAAGDSVLLCVRDTGTGIPAAELPRLFERFHRVQGARARTHEGSGIGLALVSELVKLHGGHIHADSTEGEGTSFTVRIPTGMAHLERDRVVDAPSARGVVGATAYLEEALRWLPSDGHPQHAPATVTPAPTTSPDAAKSPAAERIVLADDNADMRDYIARLLGAHWRVEAVSNGKAALLAARRERPALILSDVMMPYLDGFGLLRALRDDPALKTVPFILVSARAGEEATTEGLRIGANDYLVKPFFARELVARVSAQIELAKVRDLERRRLLGLLEQVPAIVNFLRGPDLVFEFVHPKTREVLGGRDILGKPLLEVIPEHRDQALYETLRLVYRTGQEIKQREQEAHFMVDDPSIASSWDSVYLPVRDESGDVFGVMTFDVDVTEAVRARRQLARATVELQDASRAKDDFLAMLGHELRNPLAPIATAVHLLKLRSNESLAREVSVIERQSKHITRLVDDLLDVSRIARGKVTLRKEAIEVADFVAAAIETASPAIESGRHALTVSVPKHGLVVEADHGRMTQVVANLLTNAAKYTPADGHIRVTAVREDGQAVLSVQDTGIGISSDLLPRVFDLFVQARQAIDRAQGGLGLGLALVKNLVGMHGGTVSAQSDGPGHGSTFTVHLPAVEAPVESEPAASPPRVPRSVLTQRVLVVDDNTDGADMLAEAVEMLGYRVAIAHNGPEAIGVASEFTPDVALLDLGLPVMDGYELAARLRETLHDVKLIAITGYGQEGDRRRSFDAGFLEHLTKPVDLNQLAKVLGQVSGNAHGAM